MNKSGNLADKLITSIETRFGYDFLTVLLKRLKERVKKDQAYVYYAGEISEADRTKVEKEVMRRFPSAKEVLFESDESLIGGLRVRYHDFTYEDSVQRRLENILRSKS